jgi:hypothetical protein
VSGDEHTRLHGAGSRVSALCGLTARSDTNSPPTTHPSPPLPGTEAPGSCGRPLKANPAEARRHLSPVERTHPLRACLSGMTRALGEALTATNGTATNANCWISQTCGRNPSSPRPNPSESATGCCTSPAGSRSPPDARSSTSTTHGHGRPSSSPRFRNSRPSQPQAADTGRHRHFRRPADRPATKPRSPLPRNGPTSPRHTRENAEHRQQRPRTRPDHHQ